MSNFQGDDDDRPVSPEISSFDQSEIIYGPVTPFVQNQEEMGNERAYLENMPRARGTFVAPRAPRMAIHQRPQQLLPHFNQFGAISTRYGVGNSTPNQFRGVANRQSGVLTLEQQQQFYQRAYAAQNQMQTQTQTSTYHYLPNQMSFDNTRSQVNFQQPHYPSSNQTRVLNSQESYRPIIARPPSNQLQHQNQLLQPRMTTPDYSQRGHNVPRISDPRPQSFINPQQIQASQTPVYQRSQGLNQNPNLYPTIPANQQSQYSIQNSVPAGSCRFASQNVSQPHQSIGNTTSNTNLQMNQVSNFDHRNSLANTQMRMPSNAMLRQTNPITRQRGRPSNLSKTTRNETSLVVAPNVIGTTSASSITPSYVQSSNAEVPHQNNAGAQRPSGSRLDMPLIDDPRQTSVVGPVSTNSTTQIRSSDASNILLSGRDVNLEPTQPIHTPSPTNIQSNEDSGAEGCLVIDTTSPRRSSKSSSADQSDSIVRPMSKSPSGDPQTKKTSSSLRGKSAADNKTSSSSSSSTSKSSSVESEEVQVTPQSIQNLLQIIEQLPSDTSVEREKSDDQHKSKSPRSKKVPNQTSGELSDRYWDDLQTIAKTITSPPKTSEPETETVGSSSSSKPQEEDDDDLFDAMLDIGVQALKLKSSSTKSVSSDDDDIIYLEEIVHSQPSKEGSGSASALTSKNLKSEFNSKQSSKLATNTDTGSLPESENTSSSDLAVREVDSEICENPSNASEEQLKSTEVVMTESESSTLTIQKVSDDRQSNDRQINDRPSGPIVTRPGPSSDRGQIGVADDSASKKHNSAHDTGNQNQNQDQPKDPMSQILIFGSVNENLDDEPMVRESNEKQRPNEVPNAKSSLPPQAGDDPRPVSANDKPSGDKTSNDITKNAMKNLLERYKNLEIINCAPPKKIELSNSTRAPSSNQNQEAIPTSRRPNQNVPPSNHGWLLDNYITIEPIPSTSAGPSKNASALNTGRLFDNYLSFEGHPTPTNVRTSQPRIVPQFTISRVTPTKENRGTEPLPRVATFPQTEINPEYILRQFGYMTIPNLNIRLEVFVLCKKNSSDLEVIIFNGGPQGLASPLEWEDLSFDTVVRVINHPPSNLIEHTRSYHFETLPDRPKIIINARKIGIEHQSQHLGNWMTFTELVICFDLLEDTYKQDCSPCWVNKVASRSEFPNDIFGTLLKSHIIGSNKIYKYQKQFTVEFSKNSQFQSKLVLVFDRNVIFVRKKWDWINDLDKQLIFGCEVHAKVLTRHNDYVKIFVVGPTPALSNILKVVIVRDFDNLKSRFKNNFPGFGVVRGTKFSEFSLKLPQFQISFSPYSPYINDSVQFKMARYILAIANVKIEFGSIKKKAYFVYFDKLDSRESEEVILKRNPDIEMEGRSIDLLVLSENMGQTENYLKSLLKQEKSSPIPRQVILARSQSDVWKIKTGESWITARAVIQSRKNPEMALNSLKNGMINNEILFSSQYLLGSISKLQSWKLIHKKSERNFILHPNQSPHLTFGSPENQIQDFFKALHPNLPPNHSTKISSGIDATNEASGNSSTINKSAKIPSVSKSAPTYPNECSDAARRILEFANASTPQFRKSVLPTQIATTTATTNSTPNDSEMSTSMPSTSTAVQPTVSNSKVLSKTATEKEDTSASKVEKLATTKPVVVSPTTVLGKPATGKEDQSPSTAVKPATTKPVIASTASESSSKVLAKTATEKEDTSASKAEKPATTKPVVVSPTSISSSKVLGKTATGKEDQGTSTAVKPATSKPVIASTASESSSKVLAKTATGKEDQGTSTAVKPATTKPVIATSTDGLSTSGNSKLQDKNNESRLKSKHGRSGLKSAQKSKNTSHKGTKSTSTKERPHESKKQETAKLSSADKLSASSEAGTKNVGQTAVGGKEPIENEDKNETIQTTATNAPESSHGQEQASGSVTKPSQPPKPSKALAPLRLTRSITTTNPRLIVSKSPLKVSDAIRQAPTRQTDSPDTSSSESSEDESRVPIDFGGITENHEDNSINAICKVNNRLFQFKLIDKFRKTASKGANPSLAAASSSSRDKPVKQKTPSVPKAGSSDMDLISELPCGEFISKAKPNQDQIVPQIPEISTNNNGSVRPKDGNCDILTTRREKCQLSSVRILHREKALAEQELLKSNALRLSNIGSENAVMGLIQSLELDDISLSSKFSEKENWINLETQETKESQSLNFPEVKRVKLTDEISGDLGCHICSFQGLNHDHLMLHYIMKSHLKKRDEEEIVRVQSDRDLTWKDIFDESDVDSFQTETGEDRTASNAQVSTEDQNQSPPPSLANSQNVAQILNTSDVPSNPDIFNATTDVEMSDDSASQNHSRESNGLSDGPVQAGQGAIPEDNRPIRQRGSEVNGSENDRAMIVGDPSEANASQTEPMDRLYVCRDCRPYSYLTEVECLIHTAELEHYDLDLVK